MTEPFIQYDRWWQSKDGSLIGVTKFRDRKGYALMGQGGGRLYPLAYFKGSLEASEFINYMEKLSLPSDSTLEA